jgi:hypothetical protein
MARNQLIHTIAMLLAMVSANAHAQSSSITDLASAPSAGIAHNYSFPDRRQQFHNYLYNTFGPPGLISTAIGAGLEQSKPAPPEWDSGAEGYAERYGSRFGMSLMSETTKYSLGAVMEEDVSFHRCDCTGLIPRSVHAVSSTLTARTRTGHTIFSFPALVSPYAGSFAAVNAWYPSRYEPADAFRIGSMSFVYKVAGNLVGEFIAPRR